MILIPQTENTHLIRTDFSNDASWKEICEATRVACEAIPGLIELIDDRNFEGLNKQTLFTFIPTGYLPNHLIVADDLSMIGPDYPLVVVDLYSEPGRAFRAVPSTLDGIACNLQIANMDFFEFAEAVDEDGIFRGFR